MYCHRKGKILRKKGNNEKNEEWNEQVEMLFQIFGEDICNQKDNERREADLIVLHPDKGIIFVEVNFSVHWCEGLVVPDTGVHRSVVSVQWCAHTGSFSMLV